MLGEAGVMAAFFKVYAILLSSQYVFRGKVKDGEGYH